jgi:hypothetical protein
MMTRITRSWKRLLIVLVLGLVAVFASRRISASYDARTPAATSRGNPPRDAHGPPIPNDVGDFQQLD